MTQVVGSVDQVTVYPVKSLAGRAVGEAEVSAAGLVGDRAWAVVDAGTGEPVTVKTTPVMAEGLLDRLLNSAYMITMLGRSYRPQQRPGSSSSGPSTSSGDLQVANYREQTTGNKR